MNLQGNAAFTLDVRSVIDKRIGEILAEIELTSLRNAMEHALVGGKRVRPLLCMLSCGAAGGHSLDALDAGVALELLHTSSLIHDDIMDEAVVRRGRATVHIRYGLPAAILAGDALVALAFQTFHRIQAEARERLQRTMSDAFVDLCEGQGYDLEFSRVDAVTSPEHKRMVEKKTARLLEAACAIGAMLGTANERVISALGKFGLLLGLAYQAQDDLLDVTGAEQSAGKSVGIDQRNRKKTYLTLVRPETDTLSSVSALVADYTRGACDALGSLPATKEWERLLAMARSLIGREC